MNTNIFTSEYFSFYSDMHKDAYGFRPRFFSFKTIEEYKEEIKFLEKIIFNQIEEEERQEIFNMEQLEKTINNTMEICKCKWKRAVEILMEAEEDVFSSQDIEYFLYSYGIHGSKSYEFINKFNKEN